MCSYLYISAGIANCLHTVVYVIGHVEVSKMIKEQGQSSQDMLKLWSATTTIVTNGIHKF